MLIDNCYAGGQNIDLETIRRSIPLWRSDYQVNQNFDPIGVQVPPCAECSKPSFRARLDQALVAA